MLCERNSVFDKTGDGFWTQVRGLVRRIPSVGKDLNAQPPAGTLLHLFYVAIALRVFGAVVISDPGNGVVGTRFLGLFYGLLGE